MQDAEQGARRVRIHRADYRPPAWWVDRVNLRLRIGERTRVCSTLTVRRNDAAPAPDLWLDGRHMQLLGVAIDGQALGPSDYELDSKGLRLYRPPAQFELCVVTEIDPDHNDSMEGLYRSGAMLCTQCEAHGFSRITYFPDRPDVMSRYTVRLEAERARYPVLLSNGNPGASGELEPGWHYAEWIDPFPKPCYLFAAVAGDLARVEDRWITASGRAVKLHFYCDHGNQSQLAHAIEALKQAMAWDERVYGLECDLDLYQVVAARDFNMGAMENKGLNLFNARYVLASDETATDTDREQVRAVIAHEYFHNWTGNRVTCRDWFQLSLKEGLTVFREQQFCADQGSASVERIRQVRLMREAQFVEDAGPLAHAVRPECYEEINNFYTLTVYEKGAELIRMMQTLAGAEGFNAGVRAYLRDNDGRAATIEDLIAAVERESGVDLSGVAQWYGRAGTPQVELRTREVDGGLELHLRRLDPVPADDTRVIPLRVRVHAAGAPLAEPRLVCLRGPEHVERLPAPAGALLAAGLGFSAPVRIIRDLDPADWSRLLLSEPDAVARYDAMCALRDGAYRELRAGEPGPWCRLWQSACAELAPLADRDPALLAELLTLPDTRALSQLDEPIEPLAAEACREAMLRQMAMALDRHLPAWLQAPEAGHAATAVGRRALAAAIMPLVLRSNRADAKAQVEALAARSPSMSLRMAALWALSAVGGAGFEAAMEQLLALGERYTLVLDKWFSLRAAAHGAGPAQIRELLEHPRFEWRNPNRTRAVLGSFSRLNTAGFHGHGGEGYSLLAERIAQLDTSNPQLAARLTDAFASWRRYARSHAEAMRLALCFLRDRAQSADLREVVGRCLDAD